jgi:DNA-binding response OmpR family regulator
MRQDCPAWILVADDDPVSLQFLVAALRELGCKAEGVGSGSEVQAACGRASFDLLLLDRRMPDLGGAALLRTLRQHGCATTAIAISAELDPAMRAELAGAGYADAVTKPIGVEHLTALLCAHLPQWRYPPEGSGATSADAPPGRTPPSALLEDDQALVSVGGDTQTVAALRGLFAKELETMLPRVAAMTTSELGEWLHRLRASCRYCGAARLLGAAERLEVQIKQPENRSDAELEVLIDTIRSTVSALRGI